MFEITLGKGIRMTFENGYTISIQFGNGNYCDNYNNQSAISSSEKYNGFIESKDAEIAIWKNFNDVWVTKRIWYDLFKEDLADDVKGNVSTDEVAKIINYISTLTNED